MTKKFEYTFVDESAKSRITFEYNEDDDEYLVLDKSGDMSVMYLNKQACLVLAKLLVKLAIGDYRDGFHFEFNENFDADKPTAMRVVLNTDLS